MNKSDLVSKVLGQVDNITKADATSAVDAMLDAIIGELKKGGEVRLIGFGTFSVAHRAAREGHDPRTRNVIRIPASKTPKFKAGKAFKDAVNTW
ncbi:MAG: HU family DNA-binding protein [Hyphomicrobiales bacterium]